MKQSILNLLTVCFLASVIGVTPLYSQSLKFDSNPPTAVSGTPDKLLSAKAVIRNISGSDKTVWVEMTTVSVVPDHFIQFCWGGNCFPPGTTLSLNSLVIKAGTITSDDGLIVNLDPGGVSGTSVIRFRIFVDKYPNDSLGFTMTFTIGTSDVSEIPSLSSLNLLAYPSPATDAVKIDYQLPYSVSNARIALYNLIGNELRSLPISAEFKQGTASLETSGLPDGVYIYAIIADGKRISAKRLVINR